MECSGSNRKVVKCKAISQQGDNINSAMWQLAAKYHCKTNCLIISTTGFAISSMQLCRLKCIKIEQRRYGLLDLLLSEIQV